MLGRLLLSQNCPQGQLDLPHTGNPTDVQAELWVQVKKSDSHLQLLIFGLGI